jgi:sialic acid synthase SpsE/mannose-6-phosphate isomerase-like protein (cupin superfamily)
MKLPSDNLLFVFEMANNHNGDVEHGLRIIREIHQVSRDFDFHFGFKFQYRQLDTFIHPDYRARNDVKYVRRFSETRLNEKQFQILKHELDDLGFVTVCTPFDEASVDLIEAHGIEIIKVASCSFTDWPLLERIALTDRPIIASTAGAALEDIDKVVSFFDHRQKDFALMHCVAEYPTGNQYLQLNQISLLQERYPQVPIGYSTHEHPNNTDSIKMAIAKGATIFEKHVGVATDSSKLNAYSATPEQIGAWLQSAKQALEMCGITGRRPEFGAEEIGSLCSLRRGVFARRDIKKGEKIALANVFLAIPTTDGQVTANDLSKYTDYISQTEIKQNEPILFSSVRKMDHREKVYQIVQQAKALLAKSKVVAPGKADFEISHHFGIERFDEFGITMITVINREYCKKLLLILAGQKHPEQYHRQKEETFHILYGDIVLNLNGIESIHHKGDLIVVEAGVKHSFTSKHGAVIEEISSTHYKNDSFYTDPDICNNGNRKTLLTYWMS